MNMNRNTSATRAAQLVPPRPRTNRLFERYPLEGEARLSIGSVPTPYHVYDGYGLFIGGTADLHAVRELLAPEQVAPVQTDTGRALMGIWVCNFTDASLGAHHELQFSIFVSRTVLRPVTSHPLGLIHLMLTRPDVQMLCHGLWNDAALAVAYNRELLALNARPASSSIERGPDGVRFEFSDQATHAPVLTGRFHRAQSPSLRANLTLLAQLGIRRVSTLARQPWIGMQILNPVSRALARNAVADSFTRYDKSVVRYFDRAGDSLVFGATHYRRLRFQPQFCQYMDGFRFVYLFPR